MSKRSREVVAPDIKARSSVHIYMVSQTILFSRVRFPTKAPAVVDGIQIEEWPFSSGRPSTFSIKSLIGHSTLPYINGLGFQTRGWTWRTRLRVIGVGLLTSGVSALAPDVSTHTPVRL